MEAILLTGRIVVYDSQADASKGIPDQWRTFLRQNTWRGPLFGASPCTNDRKIHYLTGVGPACPERTGSDALTLDPGEYAVVQVNDPAQLRAAWVWLLTSWLASSGRREKHAPEFERYERISADGTPIGPVEIWIP
jgi:predicted transcriptional regulator YdeE